MLSAQKMKKFENRVYFVLFVLWFTLDFVYSTSIGKYNWGSKAYYLQILSILKYFLCFYIIALKKYSWKEWIILAGVSALFFVSGRNSQYYDVFYGWLFIAASKDIPFKKIAKYTAIMSVVYLSLTVVFALTGLIDNPVYYRTELSGISKLAQRPRYALGFEHPNGFGFRMFILIFCCLYLKKDKTLRIYDYLLIAGAVAIGWFVLNSKTTCICILFSVLGFLFVKRFETCNAFWKKTILYMMVGTSLFGNIISVLLSLVYTKKGIPLFFNRLLTGRIELGNRVYREYGISLLGQQAFLTKSERAAAGLRGEIILDNAYHTMLFRFGLIIYILFTAIYIYAMVKQIRTNKYWNVFCLMLMALYGIIEQFYYMPMWNIFLLLLAEIFASDRNNETLIPESLLQKICKRFCTE